MEYFERLTNLHKAAGEILEKIKTAKKTIEFYQEQQAQFKNTFGRTSAQFANEILLAHRAIKILSRSYSKIIKQINF